jgi:phage terminase large subunit
MMNGFNKISFKFYDNYVNEVFKPLIKNQSRYLHLYGGAGSGKSVFASQKLLFRSFKERGHKILLARKVARTIRFSQFNLIKTMINTSGLREYYKIKESDMNIINIMNGSEFITAGLDDREKLKSIFGITSIWVEEATELDFADFNQLDLRLRGLTENYKQIILTYNPVNAYHWLNTKNFSDSFKLKTTYLDNNYIDNDYINVLQNLKEQDEEFYKIYTLGEWGTLKNIIYNPFQIIDVYPDNMEDTIYGLDFGYNNPTALIEIKIKDKCYYLKELIYSSRMTNTDLISKLESLNIKKNKYIYCDSAEANRIAEIKRAGFLTYPSDKNVKDGIDFIKTCSIFNKSENRNIIKEVLSYCYKQDKDGNIFDEPVKFNDHAMDAIRYAIYTHVRKRQGAQIRVIG